MSIECYDGKCPMHGTKFGGEGPFCDEVNCIKEKRTITITPTSINGGMVELHVNYSHGDVNPRVVRLITGDTLHLNLPGHTIHNANITERIKL